MLNLLEATEITKAEYQYLLREKKVFNELDKLAGKDLIESCDKVRNQFKLTERQFGKIFIKWYNS